MHRLGQRGNVDPSFGASPAGSSGAMDRQESKFKKKLSEKICHSARRCAGRSRKRACGHRAESRRRRGKVLPRSLVQKFCSWGAAASGLDDAAEATTGSRKSKSKAMCYERFLNVSGQRLSGDRATTSHGNQSTKSPKTRAAAPWQFGEKSTPPKCNTEIDESMILTSKKLTGTTSTCSAGTRVLHVIEDFCALVSRVMSTR